MPTTAIKPPTIYTVKMYDWQRARIIDALDFIEKWACDTPVEYIDALRGHRKELESIQPEMQF